MFDDILLTKKYDLAEIQKNIADIIKADMRDEYTLKDIFNNIKNCLISYGLKYTSIGRTIDKIFVNFDGEMLYFDLEKKRY